ncbi:MAG TPA: fibronectin-binding domain-containing protein [candidate division Zixibacteria bacterium]|nr:fibronectin-binding domain-containing protein [candidate division Zixibacteria bacterium]
MQTALHIYSLVSELQSHIIGAIFKGSEFFRKQREAYLLFRAKKGLIALGMIYHPHGYGAFMLPRGKIRITTTEKPWPFFQPAIGGEVIAVEQYDLDRIFRIDIQNNGKKYSIITEAIGPNGNFWLLDDKSKIIATLRNKKYDPKQPYHPPAPLDRMNPFDIELRHLIEIFKKCDQTVGNTIKKSMLALDKHLIDEIIDRADIDPDSPACELDDNSLEKTLATIKDMVRRFDDYQTGYFYEHASGNLAYPFKLHSLDSESKRCKSLSFAVYEAVRNKRALRSEKDEKSTVIEALQKYVKKLRRKVSKIENDLSNARNFEQCKKYAEILKIHLPKLKKGDDYVELVDVYSGSGKLVIIEMDPSLSPAQNADLYFKKYRKGREGLDLLTRRLDVARQEAESAETMLKEFETDFETASKRYETDLPSILPRAVEKKPPAVRLPYREHVLSTGVKIFVGRDGADNDNTTFGFAKPYELWFHTSQCPGSHVVMKFPNKDFEPSKTEILETAAIAAFHSKARNSKSVPVIYTQKKYVRKPRKAKAGLVTVEREKLVMVEPKKPE